MFGVVVAAGRQGEQALEQGTTTDRELIEGQVGTASLCKDRQEPSPRRRFEYPVAGADLGGQYGQGAQLRRRRELVERHLLLTAPCVGEAQVREISQECDDLGRCVLQPRNLRGQAAQVKHHGGFDRVIGVSPDPGTLCIGPAKGRGHHPGDQTPVQRPRAIELRGERSRGG